MERELELLEEYLDGELAPAETEAVRRQLTEAPEMASALERLRTERNLREALFTASEPEADAVERVLVNVTAEIARRRARSRSWRGVRYAGAVAACLVLGFLAGWLGRDGLIGAPRPGNGAIAGAGADAGYHVALTDASGRVVAVQKFTTLRQAVEFSEDVQRWQERQEQIRSGRVMVRSAEF